MGRITTLQNEIGHLQSVLAGKNEAIRNLTTQVKGLTDERDQAVDKLQAAKAPSDEPVPE